MQIEYAKVSALGDRTDNQDRIDIIALRHETVRICLREKTGCKTAGFNVL